MHLNLPFPSLRTLPTSYVRKRSIRVATICLLLITSLQLSGCGYTLGEIRPTPMRRVTKLAIPNFKNATLVPRIEALTTDTVIKQFQQDGTYEIVPEDEADAILYGEIAKIDRAPMRVYSSNVLQTSEFELVVLLRYQIKDRRTEEVLMKGQAEGRAPFFVNSDSINSDLVNDQSMCYPVSAQRAALRLASNISEGW